MTERPHGYARYRLDGCRCYQCGYARSEYDARRTRLIAYGRWQPWTSPADAQAHIRALKEQGHGDRHIAELAGVERKTIRDIASGIRHDPGRGNPPLNRIRATTEAAILAIPLDPLAAAPGAYIDATPTWRLVEELIEAGYTKTWIGHQIGQAGVLQLGATQVSVRNATAIRDLHDRILAGPRGTAQEHRGRGLIRSAEEILADLAEAGEELEEEVS